jgi:hypothetical protein
VEVKQRRRRRNKRKAGELTCGCCCGGSRWCSLVAEVPGGAAAVFFFPSLCKGTSLYFSSPSSSVCSSLFHFLSFVLSLFLISRLSLYSFPVLFLCLSPFCSVSLLSSFSLSTFVFFSFFRYLKPFSSVFLFFFFFLPPLPSSLSPGIYKEEKGEIGLLPCPVMAQG